MFREDPPTSGCSGCLTMLAGVTALTAVTAACVVSNRCGSRWHRFAQFAAWVCRHV